MFEFLEYRVDDFMTFPAVTIGPHATLAEAQAIFQEHDFNCVPVTEGERLVGVLTKLDVLKAFAFTPGSTMPSHSDILSLEVATVMTRAPHTVPSDAPLTRIIQLMVRSRFTSFPVVRRDEVVGIIAREDITRAIQFAAAGEGVDPSRLRHSTKKASLVGEVARGLGCRERQAQGLIAAVFQELRDRLTPKEAADVAAQLPTGLKRVWLENDRHDRQVRRIHREEFIGRVRRRAGLADDAEAERTVRAVFHQLQRALGSVTGKEGESWDIFSQLPKDLKTLWLDASARTAPAHL